MRTVMNAKRWALLFYILVAGFGLWLGQSQVDLLEAGMTQHIYNIIDNAAGVAGTVIGGIIIYILGGTKDELPTVERTSTVTSSEPVDVSHAGGPSSFESSIGKQH